MLNPSCVRIQRYFILKRLYEKGRYRQNNILSCNRQFAHRNRIYYKMLQRFTE